MLLLPEDIFVKHLLRGNQCRSFHGSSCPAAKNAYLLLSLLLILAVTACATPPVRRIAYPYVPDESPVQWLPVCAGIESAEIRDTVLPLIVHVFKVDLQHPNISVVTSEPALFLDSQGTIRAETTLAFAKRHRTLLAFNAAAFHTASMLFSTKRKIVGLHISNYQRLSPPVQSFGALLFLDDGTAKIIDNQNEEDIPHNTVCAVSGFWTILRASEVVPSHVRVRDSRMIAGLANQGKTLFIAAVEAENTVKSQGLTYDESALLMRKIGAEDALQLDGGSSSTLILYKNGKQQIVSPTISFLPLKRVASNIGIIYKDEACFTHQ